MASLEVGHYIEEALWTKPNWFRQTKSVHSLSSIHHLPSWALFAQEELQYEEFSHH